MSCLRWSGRGDLNARPPAPKAGDLLNCPSIESVIYGTCLLEVVELTSYNSLQRASARISIGPPAG